MTAPTKQELKVARSAEKVVARAEAKARPLVRDVLERFMEVFTNLSIAYQPGSREAPNEHANDQLFRYWSQRATDIAAKLIGFEVAKPVASGVPPIEFSPSISVSTTVAVGRSAFDDFDFSRLSDEQMIQYYRARVNGSSHDEIVAGMLPAAAAVLPAPSVAPSVRVPAAVSVPEPSNAPEEIEPVEEPVAVIVPAEPVAEPAVADPPNLVHFPPTDAVRQYADSIASAVGSDGRPRAIISQTAMSRATMRAGSHPAMPRTSGTFDRWK